MFCFSSKEIFYFITDETLEDSHDTFRTLVFLAHRTLPRNTINLFNCHCTYQPIDVKLGHSFLREVLELRKSSEIPIHLGRNLQWQERPPWETYNLRKIPAAFGFGEEPTKN